MCVCVSLMVVFLVSMPPRPRPPDAKGIDRWGPRGHGAQSVGQEGDLLCGPLIVPAPFPPLRTDVCMWSPHGGSGDITQWRRPLSSSGQAKLLSMQHPFCQVERGSLGRVCCSELGMQAQPARVVVASKSSCAPERP